MLDVLRNFYRPPTPAQKAADLATVNAGGELLVACWLIPEPTGEHVRAYPHGHLHVFRDRIVWKGGRKHPDRTFLRGEWMVRISPPKNSFVKFGIVSLVNQSNTRDHQELRVPTPDLALVHAVMSD